MAGNLVCSLAFRLTSPGRRPVHSTRPVPAGPLALQRWPWKVRLQEVKLRWGGALLLIAVLFAGFAGIISSAVGLAAAANGLAFAGRIADYRGSLDIYLIDADNGALRRLTDNPADDREPAWSPDGKRIAFVSDRDGKFKPMIYVMNADGTGQTRLPSSPQNFLPVWSPDGKHIAFASNRAGDWQIYVMNPDGSEQKPLTPPTKIPSVPIWTTDGRRMVFVLVDGADRRSTS